MFQRDCDDGSDELDCPNANGDPYPETTVPPGLDDSNGIWRISHYSNVPLENVGFLTNTALVFESIKSLPALLQITFHSNPFINAVYNDKLYIPTYI